MTVLLWYLGGLATGLISNYVLHGPNKQWEEKLKKLDDSLYQNSGHN
jgi:hypothetical protein